MTTAIERTIDAVEELKALDKEIDYAKPRGQAFNHLPRAIHMVGLAAEELKKPSKFDEPARFTVRGKGNFPVDMLRHDQCWPVDGDIFAINTPRKQETGLRLCALKRRLITPARWRSFGWVVTDIDGEEVIQ